MRKIDGGTLESIAIRVVPPRLSNAEKNQLGITNNTGFYDSRIEASGRYLVSLSAYESFTLLTVWDLGLCGSDIIEPLARYVEQAPLTLYLDGFSSASRTSNLFHIISTQDSSFITP